MQGNASEGAQGIGVEGKGSERGEGKGREERRGGGGRGGELLQLQED